MSAAKQDQAATVVGVPLDTVVLSLSPGMRSEYERLGEFPAALGPGSERRRSPTNVSHLMTLKEARALLAADQARSRGASGGLKTTYRTHVANLERAIDAAEKRPAQLGSGKPVCVMQGDGCEEWICTKEGLRHRFGISAVPGEPDGPSCVVRAVDARGWGIAVTRWEFKAVWPEFYRVCLRQPEGPREPRNAAERAALEREARIAEIKRLPQTESAYRSSVEGWWRTVAIQTLRFMSQATGFRYSEETVQEVRDLFDEVTEAIRYRGLAGTAPAVVLQRELAADAKADRGFQALLASVTAAAGRGAEGGAA